MLRAKFWSDLKDPELKNAAGYAYDIIKNFDELRKRLEQLNLSLRFQVPQNLKAQQLINQFRSFRNE